MLHHFSVGVPGHSDVASGSAVPYSLSRNKSEGHILRTGGGSLTHGGQEANDKAAPGIADQHHPRAQVDKFSLVHYKSVTT